MPLLAKQRVCQAGICAGLSWFAGEKEGNWPRDGEVRGNFFPGWKAMVKWASKLELKQEFSLFQ
jgi:hypothetical protein